jgi:hypothetical protein
MIVDSIGKRTVHLQDYEKNIYMPAIILLIRYPMTVNGSW